MLSTVDINNFLSVVKGTETTIEVALIAPVDITEINDKTGLETLSELTSMLKHWSLSDWGNK